MKRTFIKVMNLIFSESQQKQLPKNPKNILFFRAGMLGDVLMTTPLVDAIRNKYPKAKLTYLTGKWSLPAIATNPSVDEIMSFKDDIVFNKKIFGMLSLIKDIRKKKFDLCFVLDKSYLFGVVSRFSHIPFRIGFDRSGEGFANTHNVWYDGSQYEGEYYLQLAKFFGAKGTAKMHYKVLPKDFQKAKELLHNIKKPWIVLAPGGAKNPGSVLADKRWPVNRYKALAKKLGARGSVIVLGSPSDKVFCQEVAQDNKKVFNLCGKTTFGESAGVLALSNLFITHDSGPLHLGAAVGVKTLALFGPTSHISFAPLSATVIHSKKKGCPCYDVYGKTSKNMHCIESITVDEVYKRALRLL